MKKVNIVGIIFGFLFLMVTILRWSSIETVDRVFYCIAVLGLSFIGLAPMLTNQK